MRRATKARRPSKRQVVLLNVVLVAVALVSAGIYLYLSNVAADMGRRLEVDQKALAESQRLTSKLAASQAAFLDTQSHLRNLEQSMPTRAYVPTLLQQIEALAEKTKSQIVLVRPEDKPVEAKAPETKKAGTDTASSDQTAKATEPATGVKKDDGKIPGIDYDTQKLQLDVQGKYWDLMKFVEGLSTFPKIMAVDSVSIDPVTTDGKAGAGRSVTLHIQITAYLIKEGGAKNGRG